MISTTGDFHKFVKMYREIEQQSESVLEVTQSPCVGDACPICQQPLYERQMPIRELILYVRDIEQSKGQNAVRY
jgi:hypothetical protein